MSETRLHSLVVIMYVCGGVAKRGRRAFTADHTPTSHVSSPGCPSGRPQTNKKTLRPSTPLVVKAAAEYKLLSGMYKCHTVRRYCCGYVFPACPERRGRAREGAGRRTPTRACVQASSPPGSTPPPETSRRPRGWNPVLSFDHSSMNHSLWGEGIS